MISGGFEFTNHLVELTRVEENSEVGNFDAHDSAADLQHSNERGNRRTALRVRSWKRQQGCVLNQRRRLQTLYNTGSTGAAAPDFQVIK